MATVAETGNCWETVGRSSPNFLECAIELNISLFVGCRERMFEADAWKKGLTQQVSGSCLERVFANNPGVDDDVLTRTTCLQCWLFQPFLQPAALC